MKHSFDYTLERYNDEDELQEFDLEISGTYYPRIPEQGPSYSSGGEPEEPAWFEIEKVICLGKPFDITDEEEADIVNWFLEDM